jgi:DNA primase
VKRAKMTIIAKPDIVDIISQSIKLKQRGRSFWALCPFHQEKTPSFKVDAERQSFYCFGCGESGDVINYVMKLNGYSFKNALAHLGIAPGRRIQIDPSVTRRKEIQRSFEREISTLYFRLCNQSCELHRLRLLVEQNSILSEPRAIFYAQAMGALAEVEYKLDILCDGTIEEQISILKDMKNGARKITERRAT